MTGQGSEGSEGESEGLEEMPLENSETVSATCPLAERINTEAS